MMRVATGYLLKNESPTISMGNNSIIIDMRQSSIVTRTTIVSIDAVKIALLQTKFKIFKINILQLNFLFYMNVFGSGY